MTQSTTTNMPTTNGSPPVILGVDVSKATLDVAVDRPSEGASEARRPLVRSLPNTPEGFQDVLRLIARHAVTIVCLEATGGLQRPLVECLHQHQVPVAIINPRQVRDFARATGQLAKTDAIDAAVLCQFARAIRPTPARPKTAAQRKRADLVARRRQINEDLVREKNRLKAAQAAAADKAAVRSIGRAITFHAKQLAEVDERLAAAVAEDAEASEVVTLLNTVKGVSDVTAHALVTRLPELGRLSRGQIGKLAGLAPVNRDSGQMRGRRTTGGGRKDVRTALYMPTLAAIRWNPVIGAYYASLLKRGKEKMVALVACMRKLLTILNAIARDRTPWQEPANDPAPTASAAAT